MNFIKLSLLLSLFITTCLHAIQQLPTDTGAGVILLEMYRPNNQSPYEPAVILFRNSKTGNYEDGGGVRERKPIIEDLRFTAARELKEESLNTFRLNAYTTLNDFDAARHRQYICYFVYVGGPIYSKWYYHNMQLLGRARGVPRDWRETNGMTRVFLHQLELNNIRQQPGDLVTIDASGNIITIAGKTKACIREALNGNVIQNLFSGNPVKLEENPDFRWGSLRFLYGTKSYFTP